MPLGIVPKMQQATLAKLQPGLLRTLCESPTGPFTGNPTLI